MCLNVPDVWETASTTPVLCLCVPAVWGRPQRLCACCLAEDLYDFCAVPAVWLRPSRTLCVACGLGLDGNVIDVKGMFENAHQSP